MFNLVSWSRYVDDMQFTLEVGDDQINILNLTISTDPSPNDYHNFKFQIYVVTKHVCLLINFAFL